jgi:hypothetical protein
MYTVSDLSFILFNNRSIKGVVKNFIPKIANANSISKIEYQIEFFQKAFNSQKFVEIDKSEFDEEASDIYVNPIDINKLTEKILDSNKKISGVELEYLLNRGIDIDIINKWKLGGLSSITNYRDLEILNATCHPILKNLFEDGIDGGGIIIPLFKDEILINCAIRKISDIGKLKYSLACPDVDVWGIEDITNDEVWITEGLFDMMALRSVGIKAASVSSAMWSAIQLKKIIDAKPKSIVIFCDNDNVGLKIGFILDKFFGINGIPSKTVISKVSKDAASHIFENNISIENIKEIQITLDMVDRSPDTFNFVSYLKSRNF